MKWTRFALIIYLLIIINYVSARRGRGKSRGKGGMSSAGKIPLGGKWKDSDTAKYYTNSDGAKILKFSHFDLEYILGHKIYLICVAEGDPRPHITWFKDGIEIYAHDMLQIHEWLFGEKKIKSKMEIDPATQKDAGIYECYAENKYSIDKRIFRTDFITMFD